MDFEVLVPGKTDETYLAVLLGFGKSLSRAIGANEQLRIIVEGHAVDLPEIKMIGLQAMERFFQHLQGQAGVTAMGTRLGHQKDLVATAFSPAPIQSSVLPRRYSQQLSKKVMPPSTASWTI